jgi:hypothetical protein
MVAVLFLGGMGCVLYARHMVYVIQRPKAAPPPRRRYKQRANNDV